MLVLFVAFGMIILVLLIGGRTNNRKRDDVENSFSPPSALKMVVYARPACAEAVGVYKTHSDRQILRKASPCQKG